MTSWSDAGFGTDPEGDARRRAELEAARLDEAEYERLAILGGYGLPVVRAQQEQREAYSAEAADYLVLDLATNLGVELSVDPHAVTSTAHGSAIAVVCACGRWECVVTGPSSARWAGADHARHVRAEEAGCVE